MQNNNIESTDRNTDDYSINDWDDTDWDGSNWTYDEEYGWIWHENQPVRKNDMESNGGYDTPKNVLHGRIAQWLNGQNLVGFCESRTFITREYLTIERFFYFLNRDNPTTILATLSDGQLFTEDPKWVAPAGSDGKRNFALAAGTSSSPDQNKRALLVLVKT